MQRKQLAEEEWSRLASRGCGIGGSMAFWFRMRS